MSISPKPNPDPNSPRPKQWLAFAFLAAGFVAGAAVVFLVTRREAAEVPPPPKAAVQKAASKSKRPKEIPPAPIPRPAASAAPRVAFVLDDWGYNLQAFPLLKEIDQPM